jgi:hypothetical protein
VAQSWVILLGARRRDTADTPRPVRKPVSTASEQLEALLGQPWPFAGRPPKHDLSTWAVTPQMVRTFAETARRHIRLEDVGYRRDHLRALAQRVEVADGEVRIMGSKTRLLQALTGKIGVNSVPTQGLKWRRGGDSNPRYACTYAAFRVRCIQPLCHLSRGSG